MMKQQRRLLPTRRKTLTDNSNNSNKTRNNFTSPVTKPFAMEVEGTSSAVDALLLLRHSKERVPSPPKPTLSPLPKEEESTIVTPESTSSSAAVTTAAPTPKTTKRTPKPKRPYEPADDTPKGPKTKRRPSMSKKTTTESSSSKTNKKQTTTPPVSNWRSGEGARPPTKKDAVFGRGGLNNNMRNGTIFRELVEAHWEDYMRIHQIEIKEKRDFVYQNLMNPIVEQDGRFLVREGGFWRELSPDNAHDEKEIVKKIQQALRDEKKKHTPLAYTVAKQAVKEQQQQQALKASS